MFGTNILPVSPVKILDQKSYKRPSLKLISLHVGISAKFLYRYEIAEIQTRKMVSKNQNRRNL